MNSEIGHRFITYFLAIVWLANGLLCKILGFTPRHREIVAEILGYEHASFLTTLIGAAEVGMAIWLLLKIYTRLNAITQITVVFLMNILEFFLVPELLLWGHFNAVYALIFGILVYYWEFRLKPQQTL